MFDSMPTDAALDTIGTAYPAVVESHAEISCDPYLARLFRQIAPIAAIGAILVASVVILGWIIDIPILTSFGPSWVRMKVNAAVLFLLLGITLYLISTPYRLPRQTKILIMLRRVWQILLDNALKYTSTHAGALIKIGSAVRASEPTYFARDGGVGFDMRFADNLFGVFSRLHGNDEFPGTGIDLAIVKRIVVRHGGRAWGYGEPGKRATIHFALPVAKDVGNGRLRRD